MLVMGSHGSPSWMTTFWAYYRISPLKILQPFLYILLMILKRVLPLFGIILKLNIERAEGWLMFLSLA